jgi:hypothetical protein
MSDESTIALPVSSVRALARLTPWAVAFVVIYLLLAALTLWEFAWDYQRSAATQPTRVLYLVVMYSCFVVLFLSSAFISAQACRALHRLRKSQDPQALIHALKKAHHQLLIFLAWIAALGAYLVWSSFQPVYQYTRVGSVPIQSSELAARIASWVLC